MALMIRSKILLFVVLPLIAISCRQTVTDPKDKDMLLQIGDSILTVSKVESLIPIGVSEKDSAALFDEIVNDWITTNLLASVAKENLPFSEKIDRMVEEYRKQLIILEYRRLMADSNELQIPEDTLKAYYDLHKSDFVLAQPIIKGIYVKIPHNSSGLNDVRKWMKSATPQDIEQLEKYGINEVMQYDYFEDVWVDWSLIKDQIPYSFGDDNDFVVKHKNFETSRDGSVYMLHISDYLKSGSEMPYEYASNHIKEILIDRERRRYDDELIRSLYRKAVKDKKIIEGRYKFLN